MAAVDVAQNFEWSSAEDQAIDPGESARAIGLDVPPSDLELGLDPMAQAGLVADGLSGEGYELASPAPVLSDIEEAHEGVVVEGSGHEIDPLDP